MLNVHLRIADTTTGRPTPVRIRVTGPDGTHYAPLGRAAEFPAGRNEDVGGHIRLGRERWWYIDGACEIPLPAGVPLRVQAAKGPEWTPLDETVTLGSGQISLRFGISRWTAANPGWVSVDTRCHFIAPHAALLEAQAEGLDVVNLLATPFPMLALDANTYSTTPNLLAFSGQVSALERNGCSVVVNTFNTHPVLGKVALLNSHRPVFPLTFGGEDTDDWGICDWCDQCHRKKGLVVWVDAFEPAGGLIGGEALVAAILGKIDAIEVTGDTRKTPLLPWVYRLWDAGFRLPLVGASAKDSNKTAIGSVRTYAMLGPTPPTGSDKGNLPPPAPFPEKEGGARVGPSLVGGAEGASVFSPSPLGGGAASVASGEGFSSDSPPPVGCVGLAGSGELSWLDAVRAGRTIVTAGPLLSLARDGGRLRAKAHSYGTPCAIEIVASGQVVASGEGEIETSITESAWVACRCSGPGGFAHSSVVAVDSPARRPEAVAALLKSIEQTSEWAETHGRYSNPKRKQALLDRCQEAIGKLEGTP